MLASALTASALISAPARAEAALRNDWADLIGFGRPFIANPDLPERLRQGLLLNEPDASRFFGGATAGYTDSPLATAGGTA